MPGLAEVVSDALGQPEVAKELVEKPDALRAFARADTAFAEQLRRRRPDLMSSLVGADCPDPNAFVEILDASEPAKEAQMTLETPTPDAVEACKVTVKLHPKTMEALNQAVELNGLNRTNTINKAIQFYSFILDLVEDKDNALIVVRDGKTRQLLVC